MKRNGTLIILAFLSLLYINTYSQELPNKRANSGIRDYSKYLTLTKAQEDSIYNMLLEIYTYQYEAKKASEKAKELTNNKENKLKQILTPEQFEKYKEHLKQISDSIENAKLPPWKRK